MVSKSHAVEVDIFEGLRDCRLSRKDAVRRLLALDSFEVLHFLDLAWLHHVTNTNEEQELLRKTEFAFDLRCFSMEEAGLFQNWIEGNIDPSAVPTELLQKFREISARALRIWMDDARVDNVLECLTTEEA